VTTTNRIRCSLLKFQAETAGTNLYLEYFWSFSVRVMYNSFYELSCAIEASIAVCVVELTTMVRPNRANCRQPSVE